MKHEEWIKLSEKGQRMIIAKLVGDDIQDTHQLGDEDDGRYQTCYLCGCSKSFRYYDSFVKEACFGTDRDYLNDLNAMQYAEKQCLNTAELQEMYIRNLKNLSFDTWTKADGWQVFATVSERAEAFVMTLHKEGI